MGRNGCTAGLLLAETTTHRVEGLVIVDMIKLTWQRTVNVDAAKVWQSTASAVQICLRHSTRFVRADLTDHDTHLSTKKKQREET